MNVKLLEATTNPEKVICEAARNDYMGEWVGSMQFGEAMSEIKGRTLEDAKTNLIERLLDHGHFGPFEHPQATFAIEGVSRSCMAQLTRHRHASFDIQSMRYVSFEDVSPKDVYEGELVVTPPAVDDPDWIGRNQSEGSVDDEKIKYRQAVFRNSVAQSVQDYQDLLDSGMAPEDARFVLPIGTEVNIVMSLNVRMLMHVADMRAAADAQWEIRELTEGVLDRAEQWCPKTFNYYNEEMKNRKNRLAP